MELIVLQRRRLKYLDLPTLLSVLVSLAACAGTDGDRRPGALSPEQKKMLYIADVTAEEAPGVQMGKDTLNRIVDHVKDEIRAQAPTVLISPAVPGPLPALTMKLLFTQYEGGGAPTRFEQRSVGVAHIGADVLFLDPNGKIVAQSQAAAHFGSGGAFGLTTDIQNVEAAFEATVAALVR